MKKATYPFSLTHTQYTVGDYGMGGRKSSDN